MTYTGHQKRYFAEQLKLMRPAREREALASSMSGVRVDLNPHQVEAALFALRSPLSNGSLLADEVGLGKTIEAGLVIAQYWAERRQRILLIMPASLRTQWKMELMEKFNIPATIIERPKGKRATKSIASLFSDATTAKQVAICSYEFAAKNKNAIAGIVWDLVILDEAHRLRNVYKPGANSRAKNIKEALSGRKKLLLTATPLQNNLRELYGLTSIIDDHIFGDAAVFAATGAPELRSRLQAVCKRTLRKDVADTGTIKFTRRQVITRPYVPQAAEQELYDLVSDYLRKPHVRALPDKGRQLVTMVVRKLLASSSAAISKTLQSLIDTLEALLEGYEDNLEEEIAEDFDAYSEYREEYDDDSDEDAFAANSERDRHEIEEERDFLESIKQLADSITTDAKAVELLQALRVGFEQVALNKGQEKAVIFTESTRTQQYLLNWLEQNEYEGRIVLLNGSNNDAASRRIYAEWKERHKEDGCITSSKDANMKAAIMEEFRDKATILIGTEAAAEGINLQFCSMVVNYDLPWNPQRVEQRIGRCHRYGQRYDVVVINFVNQNNSADKRVYELLEKKFKLFEGVFGSSDEILGMLESGVDFERAVYNLYQNCQTEEQIDQAFAELQERYADVLSARKSEARHQVLEMFDEDVTRYLRECDEKTRASLDRFSRWKFDLFTAYGAKRVDTDGWMFSYQGHTYIPSWEKSKKADGIFLDSDSPVYVKLCRDSLSIPTPPAHIRFHHSSLIPEERISFFNNNQSMTGCVSIDKLIFAYGKEEAREEHLLISIVTDAEDGLEEKLWERLMEVPADIVGEMIPDARLEEKRKESQMTERLRVDQANKESLVARFNELDAWRKDREEALAREIADLQMQANMLHGQMSASVSQMSFDDIMKLQRDINQLNDEIDKKQRRMFESKDAIKSTTEKLQAEAFSMLDGAYTLENVMMFSFEID